MWSPHKSKTKHVCVMYGMSALSTKQVGNSKVAPIRKETRKFNIVIDDYPAPSLCGKSFATDLLLIVESIEKLLRMNWWKKILHHLIAKLMLYILPGIQLIWASQSQKLSMTMPYVPLLNHRATYGGHGTEWRIKCYRLGWELKRDKVVSWR